MGTTKSNRVGDVIRAFRDDEWLRLHEEEGKSIVELAEEAGMSVRHVKRSLSQARKARESRIRDGGDASSSLALGGDALESESGAIRAPAWLELVPLFPVGPFTPASECPHRGPIPEGSLLCCMVCSASGVDGHPALARNPATDPRPEPKPRRSRRSSATRPEEAGEAESKPETRRKRRSRVFGSGSPAADANVTDQNSH